MPFALTQLSAEFSPVMPCLSKELRSTWPPVVPSLMSTCSARTPGPSRLSSAWLRSLRSGCPGVSPYLSQLLSAEPK
ncbi:hypothetical protein [Saccharopolyspora sp. NPDC050642]|uniref:hypothetical protein n=1 Tax=Saccharopolyspora sp. NPDC050642 TaxID=3157099 RepID=UPI003401A995